MSERNVIDLRMSGVSVADLAHLVSARLIDSRSDPVTVEINDVVEDSRSPLLASRCGILFLARYTRTEQERDPVAVARNAYEAVAAGAAAVVADHLIPGLAELVPVLICRNVDAVAGILASEVHGRPTDDLKVVLVTGTDGKTTTTTMAAAAVAASGCQVGRHTTVDHLVGGVIDSARLTTAEAVDLQRGIAKGRAAGDGAVIIEASSIAAEQGRLNGVRADVVVFTNLSTEHQDLHGTMLRYFGAKVGLFDPADQRVAVVNIDDPWGEILVQMLELVGAVIVLVSPEGRLIGPNGRPVAVHGLNRRLHPEAGSEVTAMVDGTEVQFRVQMEGAHNVANALCALAAAHGLGVEASVAARGIERVEGVLGRLDCIPNDRGVLAYVDYAHTPKALHTVLAALRERADLRGGRIIVVAGCGGGRDGSKRSAMGAACSIGADEFIATDDNPRNERSERILDDMVDGLDSGAAVRRIPNRREAIIAAVALARPGDIIVIAGKGHERDQIVEGERIPFVDQEILAHALGATWPPKVPSRANRAKA